ncbi:hypothetical protein MUK42_14794 [Musa troglodytarum]|uniref:Uncharacterized protein n=1 Tax=Musa troglodytarum TaxID=320322 RepID=A0A9E7F949_9LILI|nr:hypothetical protein MUK42_14794 [Musa troglodytarum]
MLGLELGICVIPFTVVLASCRWLVHLVAKLQWLHASMVSLGSTYAATWGSHLMRLNSMALML